ncbi:DegT/DnrJ/EryC1/StrS family aminotransferase [Algirhabdus cladophorae]|uniref:DegT/DnrJ/EryC1/StrS family aminotransferase n=1 Tax=Algirhabdus cladophorae TaxID=3377108 RepID=UPI003B846428
MTKPDVYGAEAIPPQALDAITEMLGSGDLFRYTSENSPVALLEAEFAQTMGAKYALAVSSCSAALFLSLKALKLPRDARVLIPAFTFAAVPSAVVHADCKPVLCEVGMNYRIDLEDFEAKLDQNISAVIISHMRGHTSDMDAILSLCKARRIPVIEDAAHSLGTTWNGRNIGTLGQIGCFSFQSYKLLNAGEGGIMITDDPDLIAAAVIMSGAYEHNWQKHPVLHDSFAKVQNTLPLYNLRLNNLSAAIIRPQLAEIPRRVRDGLRNHNYVAGVLEQSPWISVPPALDQESRAPDSIQFNLVDLSDAQTLAFQDLCAERGVKVQVFGMSQDNARAFWNWHFLGPILDMPNTRRMLMRACDVRLPARLTTDQLDFVATSIMDAIHQTMEPQQSCVA